MRVGTTLHSDSFALIYLQIRGKVYVSYNCRALSGNNLKNLFCTFKIRLEQKQFIANNYKFLLTEKDLSTPRESSAKPIECRSRIFKVLSAKIYFGAMRVGTTLHSDSLALIYLQRRGGVYVSYNCRAFSENNVNN